LTIVSIYEDSFTGEQFVDWLGKTFPELYDPKRDKAIEYGKKMFREGLIGELLQNI
jgi:hypothetical protein